MTAKIIKFVERIMLRLEEMDEYKKRVYSKRKKVRGLKEKAIVIFVKRKRIRFDLKILIITPTNFEKGILMTTVGTPEEIKTIIKEAYNEIKKGKIRFHLLDEEIEEKEEERVVFRGDLD